MGINVAMLDSWGNLTDIGSWYLGGNATGVLPSNVTVTPVKPTGTAAPTYTLPPLATKISAGPKTYVSGYLAVLAAIVVVLYTL